jgi:queuine/archaeosine tRNA-ribosyltransferase
MPVGTCGVSKGDQLNNNCWMDIKPQIILGNIRITLVSAPGVEILNSAGGLHEFIMALAKINAYR